MPLYIEITNANKTNNDNKANNNNIIFIRIIRFVLAWLAMM